MRAVTLRNYIKKTAALALGGALLFLSACGSEPEKAVLQDGAEMTIAVTEMADTLNPLYADSRLAQEFFLLVYDPLWRIDANGEPVNCRSTALRRITASPAISSPGPYGCARV